MIPVIQIKADLSKTPLCVEKTELGCAELIIDEMLLRMLYEHDTEKLEIITRDLIECLHFIANLGVEKTENDLL